MIKLEAIQKDRREGLYLYILKGFRKLVITLKNVKTTLDLIRKSLFLKNKNKNEVKIVIQQNSKKKITRETFFLKISTLSI